MTTELTKAAPNNHGPIYETDLYDFAGWLTTRPGVMAVGSSCEAGPMAEAVGEYIKTFPERFALTQRPAAQTEREAFEAEMKRSWRWRDSDFVRMPAPQENEYNLQLVSGAWEGWKAARASLPAPQQATPDHFPEAKEMVPDQNTIKKATPEPHLFIGACITDGRLHATVQRLESNGNVTLVATAEMDAASLHGHDCMAQMAPATPEPVGEPWGWAVNSTLFRGEFAEDDAKAEAKRCGGTTRAVALYTRPAPGVPKGFALVPMEPTPAMLKAMEGQWLIGSQVDMAKREFAAMLTAAQAKGCA